MYLVVKKLTEEQDAFFEKLSRQFACKADTTVGTLQMVWFIPDQDLYSSEIDPFEI